MQAVEPIFLTVFVLGKHNGGSIRCYGHRNLIPAAETGLPIIASIEYEGLLIPVLDPSNSCGTATELTKDCCILVVPCMAGRRQIYTGIVIQSTQDVMELAAGTQLVPNQVGKGMRFVLGLTGRESIDVLREAHIRVNMLRRTGMWRPKCIFGNTFKGEQANA